MTMLAMARGSEAREEEGEAGAELDVVGVEDAAPVDLTRRLGLTRPPERSAIAFSVENILDPSKFTGRADLPRYDTYWRPHYDRDDSDSGWSLFVWLDRRGKDRKEMGLTDSGWSDLLVWGLDWVEQEKIGLAYCTWIRVVSVCVFVRVV